MNIVDSITWIPALESCLHHKNALNWRQISSEQNKKQKHLKNGDDVGNEFGPMFIVSFKFTTNQVHRNALAMVKIIFTKIVSHVDKKIQEKMVQQLYSSRYNDKLWKWKFYCGEQNEKENMENDSIAMIDVIALI